MKARRTKKPILHPKISHRECKMKDKYMRKEKKEEMKMPKKKKKKQTEEKG